MQPTATQHCPTLNHKFRSWSYCCKVNRRIKICRLKLNVRKSIFVVLIHFVVVRCIFLEMPFVVIIMVIISYVLKKQQEGCRRLCENTKGGHEPKTVEKHSIRKDGPLLNAAFSKWPTSQINCPPLF